jgi:hypothetical protein
MSLTSFLEKNQDVRDRFRKEFQQPRFSLKRELMAPPLSKRYSLVGTAFDYLLRFYLRLHNPHAIDRKHWTAEDALALIADNPSLHSKGQEIVAQAKRRLAAYLKTEQLRDELIESALLLATLDPIFRAGVGHENVGNAYAEDIQDLRNLISIVDPDMFKASALCLLNPTFGIATRMVGGADADLVIDDTIVDIKCTTKLAIPGTYFHQLIGYYVLHEIGGVGELTPKPEIKKVAIYFARYAYLHVLDLEQIVHKQTLPAFIQWFKNRAGEEYSITLVAGHPI